MRWSGSSPRRLRDPIGQRVVTGGEEEKSMEFADQSVLPARVEARVRSAIGAISGCHVLAVDSSPPRAANILHRPGEFSIRVAGWSPSLHQATMHWSAKDTPDATGEQRVEDILSCVKWQMTLQQRFLDWGLARGIAAPLPIPGLTSSDKIEVGHLSMDHGLASLLHAEGTDILTFARETVYNLNQESDGRNSALFNDEGIEDLVIHSLVKVGDHIFYDGRALWINQDVPDTILAAVVGRRLGEVAEVPAIIADHLITGTDVENIDEGFEILIKPKLHGVPALAEMDL